MSTAQQILEELKPLGRDSYKRVMVRNHGVPEPIFGVPISELKKIQKRIRKDYRLALDLYDTGNYDAMYLAGLIADDARMTRADLEHWVAKATSGCLPGTTVPSVAAGSPHGWALAQNWIDDSREHVAAAGWATLAAIVSVTPDASLDLPALRRFLTRATRDLHQAPDRVRYQMNGFVIAAGCFVTDLTEPALAAAAKIGQVVADLGPNSCQVPDATASIHKVRDRGALGKKRKSAKC